jgi:hypothetical protein
VGSGKFILKNKTNVSTRNPKPPVRGGVGARVINGSRRRK